MNLHSNRVANICLIFPFLTPSQILCLVHENNDLFFRYTNYETTRDDSPSVEDQKKQGPSDPAQVIVKLLPWFNEHGKVIRDISFDPSNERLLVLCDDNTLHIVPVLAIVQQDQQQATDSSAQKTIITSYVIPFVGPHECPNPRTCPNNFYRPPNEELEKSLKTITADLKKAATLDDLYSTQSVDRLLSTRESTSTYCNSEDATAEETPPKNDNVVGTVCPYPTAVVWWQTKRRQDRAIVGYSDGSVCFLCKRDLISLNSSLICPISFQPSPQTARSSRIPLYLIPWIVSTSAAMLQDKQSLYW